MNLIHGDSLDELPKLGADSIDALVTDPPAGISFMGKEWDSDKGGSDKWRAWLTQIARECYRVMKPGAHGLVWAIPRTSHWTGTALEQAGFEIRDFITHLFGSGFPKSLDISKAIDREAGAERVCVGKQTGVSVGDTETYSGEGRCGFKKGEFDITTPATPAAKQWEGWGTALKPACEIWWLIRKPCSERTVAQNVLKWGTGGLNIDGCRVGTETMINQPAGSAGEVMKTGLKQDAEPTLAKGRFPSHLTLDEEAAKMLDEQSGELTSGELRGEYGTGKTECYGEYGKALRDYSKSKGGASRFFYCAKPSRGERNEGLEGKEKKAKDSKHYATARLNDQRMSHEQNREPTANHHPTVKAVSLMRYLCRLITPPKGVVLDPFMGSGTTGIAAHEEGFDFIGIEKDREYYKIAEARIEEATKQGVMF